jgi:hypothetical protein
MLDKHGLKRNAIIHAGVLSPVLSGQYDFGELLLSRERLCGDGRALELWRKLHAEWHGNMPEVMVAQCVQDAGHSTLQERSATLGGILGMGEARLRGGFRRVFALD